MQKIVNIITSVVLTKMNFWYFVKNFFEASVSRDAEDNFVHFYFLPVALQMCPQCISNLYLNV